MARKLILFLVHLFFKLTSRITITGEIIAQREGNYVVVANHLGALDIALLYHIAKRDDLIVIVADKHYKSRWKRWLGNKVGILWIDRENPDVRLLKHMYTELKKGVNALLSEANVLGSTADLTSLINQAEAESLQKLAKRYIDIADPLQKYREQLDEINKLRDAGLLSGVQALEAEWAVNESMQKQIDTMNGVGEKLKENASFAREFGLTFSSAMEDALVSGKDLSEVVKGLGDDIARLIYRKKITEPLGNAASKFIDDFDFGRLLGFATGGSFTVGGGGGTDTSLVAFRATPGERVTVTPPGGSHETGSVVIQQHIYPSPGVSSGDLMQAMVRAKNAAVAEIVDRQRRGA